MSLISRLRLVGWVHLTIQGAGKWSSPIQASGTVLSTACCQAAVGLLQGARHQLTGRSGAEQSCMPLTQLHRVGRPSADASQLGKPAQACMPGT